MNTKMKQMVALTGWLAMTFYCVAAHADTIAPRVGWTATLDSRTFRVNNREHTFSIGDAKCLITAANNHDGTSTRGLVCWIGDQVKIPMGARVLSCSADDNELKSVDLSVDDHSVMLSCNGGW